MRLSFAVFYIFCLFFTSAEIFANNEKSNSHFFPAHKIFGMSSDKQLITILWSMGKKDINTTKYEYKSFWPFIDFASSIGYDVLVNTHAVVEDYLKAIQDERSYLLIISAHGNEDGFYDYEEKQIPYSAFKNSSKNLKQVILGACYGKEMLPLYNVPKRIKVHAWEGTIDTHDFFKFINSKGWKWLENLENLSTEDLISFY